MSDNLYFVYISAQIFLRVFEKPELDIRNRLSEERAKQVQQNRLRLVPILKTIIFHGHQNIPLRGHRDTGPLFNKDGDFNLVENNDGCFRALLRFRIDAGDVQLEEHLKNTGARATYIGKNTANQLINCCEQEIISKIVGNVYEAEFYSIIFDETTDISHHSQLSLTVRFVYQNEIKECFLGFVDLHKSYYTTKASTSTSSDDNDNAETNFEPKITGEILGKSVLKHMKLLGLNLEKCVGIGCDNCSVNLSKVKGAAQEIKKEAKNARICPCFSHSLNLVLSQSVKVKSVKNCLGSIQEIVTFFSLSAKRNYVLEKYLKCKLKSPCQTRWIERHDSILQFTTDLLNIVKALREISEWDDNLSSSKANILLKVVCDCDFIFTVFCLSDIFSLTLPLAKYLQGIDIDIHSAKLKVSDLLNALNQKRTDLDSYFLSIIFPQVQQILLDLDVDLTIPRLCGRQTQRQTFSDSATLSPNDYWKRSVYIPILDIIIADLNDRFGDNNLLPLNLNTLIPYYLNKINHDSLKQVLSDIILEFGGLLGHPSLMQLLGEIQLYKQRMVNTKNALEALQKCDKNYFPLVHQILKILCTLTISVATAERSFSSLRLIKSYLRSTMTEDRLNGLALLYVHRNIDLDIESVINRFANKKRRLDFTI